MPKKMGAIYIIAEADLAELQDDIAKLDGTGKYAEPSNTCRNCGYYAKSLEQKWRQPLKDLREGLRNIVRDDAE